MTRLDWLVEDILFVAWQGIRLGALVLAGALVTALAMLTFCVTWPDVKEVWSEAWNEGDRFRLYRIRRGGD